MDRRTVKIQRKTRETDISLALSLDGSGTAQLETGLPFLEHMLTLWCRHGFFDLTLEAVGDLKVDHHHLTEDIGLCLGRALREALGKKEGINRYGSSLLPMDDALVLAAVDLSGRPFLHYEVGLSPGKVGNMEPELFLEFWRAVVNEGRLNLHIKTVHGYNNHHLMEAVFKATGRALKKAVSPHSSLKEALSTKGCLE